MRFCFLPRRNQQQHLERKKVALISSSWQQLCFATENPYTCAECFLKMPNNRPQNTPNDPHTYRIRRVLYFNSASQRVVPSSQQQQQQVAHIAGGHRDVQGHLQQGAERVRGK